MTVSPEARTPSADLHTLAGSTPTGATRPMKPFGIAKAPPAVTEMPDTWQALGSFTTGILDGLTPSHRPDPDLAALVDEFEAKEREANALAAANKGTDCEDVPEWSALADRLSAITATLYDIRAESMADVLLVSRFLQFRWIRDDRETAADLGHNLADDLLRLNARSAALSVPAPDDAGLLALGRAWEISAARCDAATAVFDAACERLEAPAAPEALFVREGDRRIIGPYGTRRAEDGRWWFGDPATIATLRMGGATDAGAQRRAEILAAYDAWRAACRADEEASGYTAAYAADHEAAAENAELRHAILEQPAATMAGVAVKVRVALWCFGEVGLIAEYLAQEAKDAPSAGETAAVSVLLDLARMAAAESAYAAPRRFVSAA